MRAELDAIEALMGATYTIYSDRVPASPTMPYLILWSSTGAPSPEVSVLGEISSIEASVGVTAVSLSKRVALTALERMRAALNPGGLPKTLTVAGRHAVLRLHDSLPVSEDTSVTFVGGTHPMSGVDLYRIVSTPA